jgi:large subunit ribosomal protein L19
MKVLYSPSSGSGDCRSLSSAFRPEGLVSDEPKEEKTVEGHKHVVPLECRFVYPEFLPDPRLDHRNSLREKLERMDMLNRRAHIDIAEFYVGKFV